MVLSDVIVASRSGFVHDKIDAAPPSKSAAAAPEMGDGRDQMFPSSRRTNIQPAALTGARSQANFREWQSLSTRLRTLGGFGKLGSASYRLKDKPRRSRLR